jgi:UDP-N-acetylmuramate--alanine ligase
VPHDEGIGTDIGTIHFVGIGGIGMSGIAGGDAPARLLGFCRVPTIRLAMCRKAAQGRHSRQHRPFARQSRRCRRVVCSSAIKDGNPEMVAAAERRLPRVRRAEMLAELMRMQKTVAVAGTHGKTTTTVDGRGAARQRRVDPTVINGGIINRYGSNARLGKSDWWVIEADESDGSFLRLDGTIAVVTNIDPEHLEHYGSFDRVKDAFVEFIENVPFYGSPCCASIIPRCRTSSAGSATGGSSPTASPRLPTCAPTIDVPVRRQQFDAIVSSATARSGRSRHRRADARAAQCPERARRHRRRARARTSDEQIREGFARFDGVKRRFSKVGEVDGCVIIDDYAHHPVEIRAVLSAARESADQRVIAVMQPHRFTRLQT